MEIWETAAITATRDYAGIREPAAITETREAVDDNEATPGVRGGIATSGGIDPTGSGMQPSRDMEPK